MPLITQVIIRSVPFPLLFLLVAWLSTYPFYDYDSPIVRGPVLLSDPLAELRPNVAAQQAASYQAHGDQPTIAIMTR